MAKSYQSSLDWFGSPEAYAAEIKRKQAAGQALSNPTAAAAFMKDYANLFAAPSGGTQRPATQASAAVSTARNTSTPTTSPSGIPYGQPTQAPDYTNIFMRTPEQMQEQATLLARLQIDPQREALNRALEQAMANAEAQRQSIIAAYQGVPERLQQAAAESERRATESAAARGVLRSGGLGISFDKIAAEQQRQLGQAQAEQAARLAAIAEQLGLTQRQTQEQLTNLATREGQLASAYIPQAEEAQFARQMQVLPYNALTAWERSTLPLSWTETIGQVPAYAPGPYPSGAPSSPQPIAPATGAPTQGSIYQNSLNWFGSPEAYAAEIKRKEAAGIPFSNPAEAAAFKRDYPHLFA